MFMDFPTRHGLALPPRDGPTNLSIVQSSVSDFIGCAKSHWIKAFSFVGNFLIKKSKSSLNKGNPGMAGASGISMYGWMNPRR